MAGAGPLDRACCGTGLCLAGGGHGQARSASCCMDSVGSACSTCWHGDSPLNHAVHAQGMWAEQNVPHMSEEVLKDYEVVLDEVSGCGSCGGGQRKKGGGATLRLQTSTCTALHAVVCSLPVQRAGCRTGDEGSASSWIPRRHWTHAACPSQPQNRGRRTLTCSNGSRTSCPLQST